MSLVGVLMFGVSTCTQLWLIPATPTGPTGTFAEPWPLKRVASEFSVGLSRSNSIAHALTELGPMCTAGQVTLLFLRVGLAVSFAALAYPRTRINR